MKKVISLVLVLVLALSVVAMVGCGKAEPVKFGMGVVANYGDAKNADGDTNGSGQFTTTAVAVLLDADNKIVAIDLDSAQIGAAWTAKGKAIATEDLATKYEKGTDYGMAAYGKKHDGSEGAVKEWNEQADAFMLTVMGRTLDEVKALMGEDTYAIGDLAAAGCTMSVGDFVAALEKAVADAAESTATAENVLNLAIVSSASTKDASDDGDGSVEINSTIAATVADADGKVVVAKTDCTQGKVTFNKKGAATVDTKAEVKSKLELGDDYGMAAYGKKHDGSEGEVLEWYAQADEFNKALVGKTVDEIASVAGDDGYPTGDLATAGCTMNVYDMIAAATNAMKEWQAF